MSATFSVAAPTYRGSVRLRLRIEGLSLTRGSLPKTVTVSGDRKTAMWSISALTAGKSSVSLKGTTKVTPAATFAVENGGSSELDIVGDSRTLRRATGRVKLADPKVGTLTNGERITFRGTIAAATCDAKGRGAVRLHAKYPQAPSFAYTTRVVVSDPVPRAAPLCTFRAVPSPFVRLGTYAGRALQFWVRSTVDGRKYNSAKARIKVANRP